MANLGKQRDKYTAGVNWYECITHVEPSIYTRAEDLPLLQREGLYLNGGVTQKKTSHSDK